MIDKVVEEQEKTRVHLEKQIEDTANAIHQLSASLGKSAPEMDVFEDMSLKQMLRNYQVQEGKLVQEKKMVMRELKNEWNTLHALWSELGTPRDPAEFDKEINVFDPNGEFEAVDETKLGCKTVQRYRLMVQHWQVERDKRMQTVGALTGLIGALEDQLGEPSSGGGSGAPCGFGRIRGFQERVESLETERSDRRRQLEGHWAELDKLYTLLATPAAEQLERGNGAALDRRTLDGVERELIRVRALKGAKMRELVARAAQELGEAHAELGMEEPQALEARLAASPPTEEALTQLQEELRQVQSVLASCRQITELVPRRQDLRAKHVEVIARQQDPSRLMSKRGGCSLLEEQKMEARVKRDLPPLEARMLALIERWEHAQGREFCWQGQPYAAVIRADQAADEAAVQERKERIAMKKMSDKDQSAIFDRSMAMPAAAAPSFSAKKSKPTSVRSTAVVPRVSQSARPVTKTRPRTAMATPTNVAARTTSVSVSRAPTSASVSSSVPRSSSRSRERPETTPVARSQGGKYSKVKSRIDTGRRDENATSNRAK